MQSARAKVLEHLDQDVVARLKGRKGELDNAVDDFTRRLVMIARAELPGAVFHPEALTRFDYQGKTYTTRWPEADDHDWQFFRLTEGNLASEVVAKAKARDHGTAATAVRLRPSAYAFPGQLADVRNLAGRSGWLRVSKAQVRACGAVREELMVSCITDDGDEVSPETADRMLMVPADDGGPVASVPPAGIAEIEAGHFGVFSERVKKQNFRWLEEEEARLDNYAKDIEIELDARITELDGEIKALRKERRSPDLSMEEKLLISRKAKKLEGEMDDLKLSKHERRREVRKQVEDMLDDVAESLSQKPAMESLFSVRWSIE